LSLLDQPTDNSAATIVAPTNETINNHPHDHDGTTIGITNQEVIDIVLNAFNNA
jgi:hypothetical protein